MMKVGLNGSIAHVLTNEKIENKAGCIKDITVQSGKDILTLAGTTAAVGAVAAGATKFGGPKVTGLISKAKNHVSGLLDKVSVSGKSLKEVISNTNIYKKFAKLPAPAKAAIAAGTVALALIHPIWSLATAAKAGAIEAQHETK